MWYPADLKSEESVDKESWKKYTSVSAGHWTITLSGPTVITKTTRGAMITSDMGETPKSGVPTPLEERERCAHLSLSSKKKKGGKAPQAGGRGGAGQGGWAGLERSVFSAYPDI